MDIKEIRRLPRVSPNNKVFRHITEGLRDTQKEQMLGMLRDQTGARHPFPRNHRPTHYRGDASFVLQAVWAVMNHRYSEFQARCEAEDNRGLHNRLFHGTKEKHLGKIMLQSLRLPKEDKFQMFGKAVYLTPHISKSFTYTNKIWDRSTFAPVLVCQGLLGRIKQAGGSDYSLTAKKAQAEGFDTTHGGKSTAAWAGTLKLDEYAVYDPSRIFVTHVLVYKPVNMRGRR